MLGPRPFSPTRGKTTHVVVHGEKDTGPRPTAEWPPPDPKGKMCVCVCVGGGVASRVGDDEASGASPRRDPSRPQKRTLHDGPFLCTFAVPPPCSAVQTHPHTHHTPRPSPPSPPHSPSHARTCSLVAPRPPRSIFGEVVTRARPSFSRNDPTFSQPRVPLLPRPFGLFWLGRHGPRHPTPWRGVVCVPVRPRPQGLTVAWVPGLGPRPAPRGARPWIALRPVKNP